jgi:hypothetical protein
MDAVTGFARFWYDFIIGDDWLIAVLVAATLVVLRLVNHGPWFALPIVVIVALGLSLYRATR